MKKPVFIRLILLSSFAAVFASSGLAQLSDHVVHYKIEAKLDVKTKIITGRKTLNWLNTSEVPVSDLRFHLYLNAFKNNRSTFMKESGGSSRGFRADKD